MRIPSESERARERESEREREFCIEERNRAPVNKATLQIPYRYVRAVTQGAEGGIPHTRA